MAKELVDRLGIGIARGRTERCVVAIPRRHIRQARRLARRLGVPVRGLLAALVREGLREYEAELGVTEPDR